MSEHRSAPVSFSSFSAAAAYPPAGLHSSTSPEIEALVIAAGKGEIKKVKSLLSQKAPVSGKNNAGDTALLEATYKGHRHVVVYLLGQKASLREKDKDGNTALLWAAGNGDVDLVDYLLAQNSSLEERNKGGNTALLEAAGNGHRDMVAHLLDQKASLSEKNNGEHTAMLWAAAHREVYVVAYLLAQKASLKERNRQGQSAFDLVNQFAGSDAAKTAEIIAVLKKAQAEETLQARSDSPAAIAKTVPSVLEHQDRLPSTLVTKLARAEQQQQEKEQGIAFFAALELAEAETAAEISQAQASRAGDVQLKEQEEKQIELSLLKKAYSGLDNQLKAVVKKLDKTVPRHPCNPPKPAMLGVEFRLAPADLTDAQKEQLELAREVIELKLTQIFVEALAVRHKLLDSKSTRRSGAIMSGAVTVLGFLSPIPGGTLLASMVNVMGKFAISKLSGAVGEKLASKKAVKNREHLLGEISTTRDAAKGTEMLTDLLLRRFQLTLVQLKSESLEIFIDGVIQRMMLYWATVPELFKTPEETRVFMTQGVFDLTRPLHDLPAPKIFPLNQQLTAEQREEGFSYLMENMLLGTSLYQGRGGNTQMDGVLASTARKEGVIGEASGLILGDRPVEFQSGESAMIQDICQVHRAVTWSGDKDAADNPLYRYAELERLQVRKSDNKENLPMLYISAYECAARGFWASGKAISLALPILPPELIDNPLTGLRRQLADKDAEIASLKAALSQQSNSESARIATVSISSVDSSLFFSASSSSPVPATAPIIQPASPGFGYTPTA